MIIIYLFIWQLLLLLNIKQVENLIIHLYYLLLMYYYGWWEDGKNKGCWDDFTRSGNKRIPLSLFQ